MAASSAQFCGVARDLILDLHRSKHLPPYNVRPQRCSTPPAALNGARSVHAPPPRSAQEEGVRRVIEEVTELEEHIRVLVQCVYWGVPSAPPGTLPLPSPTCRLQKEKRSTVDHSLATGLMVQYTSAKRNKRLLLAYL